MSRALYNLSIMSWFKYTQRYDQEVEMKCRKHLFFKGKITVTRMELRSS